MDNSNFDAEPDLSYDFADQGHLTTPVKTPVKTPPPLDTRDVETETSSSDTEEETESEEVERETPKRIPASEIYCVMVNDTPFFYANNLGIAKRNLFRYVRSFIRRQPDTFRLKTVSETEYHLVKDVNFFINYERLEHVFTIHAIPKLGFVSG